MEKEFSFLEMLKYCLRKWFIVLISVVLAGGALFVYAIGSIEEPVVQYNGSITFGNFDVFYPAASGGSESIKNYMDKYNAVFNRAVEIMLVPGIKSAVYRKVILDNTTVGQSPIILEKIFLDSISVDKSGLGISVTFKYSDKTEADKKLATEIVDTYVNEAMAAAVSDDVSLSDARKLFKNRVYISADLSPSKSRSITTNLILGVSGGLVLGIIITSIIYFADRRVKSHLDVVCFAGEKIFRANSGVDNSTVCPKLSSVLEERAVKSVLITSTDDDGFALGEQFAAYCVATHFKTLLIDFSGGDGIKQLFATGLGDGNNVIKSDISDAALILANRTAFDKVIAKFDRVVICARFDFSGQLAPLGVICGGIVTVVNQPSTLRKDVEAMIYEISQLDKCLGTVINNTSKSYVGKYID